MKNKNKPEPEPPPPPIVKGWEYCYRCLVEDKLLKWHQKIGFDYVEERIGLSRAEQPMPFAMECQNLIDYISAFHGFNLSQTGMKGEGYKIQPLESGVDYIERGMRKAVNTFVRRRIFSGAQLKFHRNEMSEVEIRIREAQQLRLDNKLMMLANTEEFAPLVHQYLSANPSRKHEAEQNVANLFKRLGPEDVDGDADGREAV